MKQIEEIKCQVCGSTDVIYDGEKGELICSKCGIVIEERPIIDMGAEWRDFGDKPSRARAQAIDETQPNLGIGFLRIGTIVGKKYSIGINRKMEAITRTSNSIERNVMTIRRDAKQLLAKLSLPNHILSNVIRDYRKLAERGYRAHLKATAVALTYLNCKKEGIPCRLKTLVKTSGIDGHGLNRVITKIRQAGYDKLQSNGSDVMKYVTALVNSVDTGPISKKNVYSFVMDLLNKAHEKRLLNGKSNYSVAAAAVYIAMMIFGIRTKQRDVASIANVTDVTIRSRYRELMEKIEIEVII